MDTLGEKHETRIKTKTKKRQKELRLLASAMQIEAAKHQGSKPGTGQGGQASVTLSNPHRLLPKLGSSLCSQLVVNACPRWQQQTARCSTDWTCRARWRIQPANFSAVIGQQSKWRFGHCDQVVWLCTRGRYVETVYLRSSVRRVGTGANVDLYYEVTLWSLRELRPEFRFPKRRETNRMAVALGAFVVLAFGFVFLMGGLR